MNDTATPPNDAPVMQDYDGRVYHLETYVAFATVRAETPQAAIEKLQQMEADGDLSFDEFCEGEPANEFVVETSDGNLTMDSRPEYCLSTMRNLCRELAQALSEATSHLLGAALNAERLGQRLEAQQLLTTLSVARAALARFNDLPLSFREALREFNSGGP